MDRSNWNRVTLSPNSVKQCLQCQVVVVGDRCSPVRLLAA